MRVGRRWVLGAVALLVVAAGGAAFWAARSASSHNPESISSGVPSEESTAGAEPQGTSSCTSRQSGGAIEVTIYGSGGAKACETWDQSQAKANESFWQVVGAPEPRSNPLCSMTKEGTTVEIRHTEADSLAERLCARLTASGWSETEGPGEQAEAREAHQEAIAKAERERAEAASKRRLEAQQRREWARAEAQQREAMATDERQAREDTRRGEEETHRGDEETHRSEEEAHRAEEEGQRAATNRRSDGVGASRLQRPRAPFLRAGTEWRGQDMLGAAGCPVGRPGCDNRQGVRMEGE